MKKAVIGAFFIMATSSISVAQTTVIDSTTKSTSSTKVESTPPTAVAPSITTINNDVCAVAASGAVQTQILGISVGGTMRDMNCERIKLAKNLYDMGMKVAAVATLCQDERIFTAMIAAGTPCPVEGKIGQDARDEWEKRGVINKTDKSNVGAYGVNAPKDEPKKVESRKDEFLCKDFAGDDPIVKQRLGCK